ncbi:sensor histidine kinase [Phytoactinopolyspora limicola]|uniref:sensor histidine kinase n=1 Tax=Phytoactinopolyspora limicola TaxID=2715536 RepID=UPI00140E8DE5|nr:histidine kinase [Phytoactinopolyspora limicola]
MRIRGRRADVLIAVAAWAVDTADLLVRTHDDVSAPRILAAAAGLVIAAAALTARRQRPTAVLVVVVAAEAGLGLAAGPQTGLVSTVTLVALYSAGRYLPLTTGWAAGAGAILVLAAATMVRTESWSIGLEFAVNFLVIVVGQFIRARAELVEQRRAQAAQAAVHAERRRIARELHDVVAHHISVMNVLVGAARTTMIDDPGKATEALSAGERTGREAMTEMRQLLAVLRADDADDADDGPDGTEPTPGSGTAGLPSLVALTTETGVAATLEVTGEPRPLPAAVDLAVYRVAQEALTNTRKHAGRVRARVRLNYEPDAIEIEVADDGPNPQAGTDGGGYGLTGMAERVALCGGRLMAGPRPEGGFIVAARIPLPAAPPDPDHAGRVDPLTEGRTG